MAEFDLGLSAPGATMSTGGTFGGTLIVLRFAASDGQVVALGTITGTVLDSAGRPVGTLLNLLNLLLGLLGV